MLTTLMGAWCFYTRYREFEPRYIQNIASVSWLTSHISPRWVNMDHINDVVYIFYNFSNIIAMAYNGFAYIRALHIQQVYYGIFYIMTTLDLYIIYSYNKFGHIGNLVIQQILSDNIFGLTITLTIQPLVIE